MDVTRFPPVICPNGHRQKRATVIERVRERKPFMFCDECGGKTILPDFDKPQTIGLGTSPWLQREQPGALAQRVRSPIDARQELSPRVAMPRCYVSRLPEQVRWAEKLVHDLRDAGVYVVEQARAGSAG